MWFMEYGAPAQPGAKHGHKLEVWLSSRSQELQLSRVGRIDRGRERCFRTTESIVSETRYAVDVALSYNLYYVIYIIEEYPSTRYQKL